MFLLLCVNEQDCLMGILKEKTIIYVTHQVEFLPAADLILVIILSTTKQDLFRVDSILFFSIKENVMTSHMITTIFFRVPNELFCFQNHRNKERSSTTHH